MQQSLDLIQTSGVQVSGEEGSKGGGRAGGEKTSIPPCIHAGHSSSVQPLHACTQGSAVIELQAELASRTAHSVSLQSELQALQFRIQQAEERERRGRGAEEGERNR